MGRLARLGRRRGSPAPLLLAAALASAALPRCWVVLSRARGCGSADDDRRGTAADASAGRRSALGLAAGTALALAPEVVAGAPAENAFSSVGSAGESVVLSNGMVFPKASFGPQVYGDGTARKLTRAAVQGGFRNFFASVLARNQRGFAQGIQDSNISRKEIFVCGSVDTRGVRGFEKAYRDTKRGCDDNLEAFAVGGIDYVDMIMLDYPAADCESIKGQWKAFEEMLASGKTRSLAVSNFNLRQLDCILSDSSLTPPTVNQLRFNVEAYDEATTKAVVEENRKRGIVVQAWSPLRVKGPKRQLAEKIAKGYGKSFAQVLLRWIVQSGATYTTQSSRADRLAESADVFDFALSEEEMRQLSA